MKCGFEPHLNCKKIVGFIYPTKKTKRETIKLNNEETTHIVCVIDRSGSMSSLMNDVIGGFNQFVTDQKALDGDAALTLVLFDDEYSVIWDRLNLQEVPELTSNVCFARGTTALNDAFGRTIDNFSNEERVMFFVNTDGYENASREYTAERVKQLVEEQTAKGWDFQFAGAGIDAFAVGGNYGVSVADTLSVSKTSAGVHTNYATMNVRAANYRGVRPTGDVTN